MVTRAAEGSLLFAGSNEEHGIFKPESTQAKVFRPRSRFGERIAALLSFGREGI